jgi:(p)ppGpp synthase/HD superfamily hydrolase
MQSNYAYRIMQAKWIDSSQQEFKAILNITGMDTLGLTNELTKVISNNMNVNIQSIALKAMLDCLRTTNSNCTKHHYFENENKK